MATHTHNPADVRDSGDYFIIDPISRVIKYDSETNDRLVIMQYDDSSERITFEMPREIDGHDMKLCNSVEVHYINKGTNATSEGIDAVTDLDVAADDNSALMFSWLVPGNATKYPGTISFIVRFKCIDDNSNTVYVWNTAVCNDILVESSISVEKIVVDKNLGILEEWEKRLFNINLDFITDEETGEVKLALLNEDGSVNKTSPDLRGPKGQMPKFDIGEVSSDEEANAYFGYMEDVDTYVLNLSLPEGETGPVPKLGIGEFKILEPNESASASITGSEEEPLLNLSIPKPGRDSIVSLGNNRNIQLFIGTNDQFKALELTDEQRKNVLAIIEDDTTEEKLLEDVSALKGWKEKNSDENGDIIYKSVKQTPIYSKKGADVKKNEDVNYGRMELDTVLNIVPNTKYTVVLVSGMSYNSKEDGTPKHSIIVDCFSSMWYDHEGNDTTFIRGITYDDYAGKVNNSKVSNFVCVNIYNEQQSDGTTKTIAYLYGLRASSNSSSITPYSLYAIYQGETLQL